MHLITTLQLQLNRPIPMKHLLYTALSALLVCCTITSQAQDTPTPYKWDASIDIYELLKSGTGNAMIRYAPKPDQLAYRFSVNSLHFSHSKGSYEQTGNKQYTSNSFNIGASAGIEFRKTMERVQLYAGPGVHFSVNHSKGEQYNSSGEIINEFKRNQFTVGPEAFAGIRYFILPQLAISAESAFRLQYHKEPVNNEPIKSNVFSGSFIPLRAIHVSLFF